MARVGDRSLRVVNDDFSAGYEGTGDTAYDPDGFYVISVNKHDHTRDTRVPMRPEVKNAIDEMLASGMLAGTPIKGYGAFMRDAAIHQLHRLARITGNPDIAVIALKWRQIAILDQAVDEAEELAKLVKDADDRLNASCKRGDVDFTRHMIEVYESFGETIREPYAADLEASLADARRWLKARS